ncbi:Myb DNA-binding domain containing protein [Trichuris trichiura]|uniref:Myb DNA-binding domain containing protein n=1 Tax=Trichuris trichiura TaxID=36087 RepID=A0A077YXU2_TRITR|nr:Myb DNA-binding domain containing protein [Trichuris trichiura]
MDSFMMGPRGALDSLESYISNEEIVELREWLDNNEVIPTQQAACCLASAFLLLVKRAMNNFTRLIEQLEDGKESIGDESLEGLTISRQKTSDKVYFNPYFRDEKKFMPKANRDSIAIRKRKLPDMLAPDGKDNKDWTLQEIIFLHDCDILNEAEQKVGKECVVEKLLNCLAETKNNIEEIKKNGPLLDAALSNADSVDLIDWNLVAVHPFFTQWATDVRTAKDCYYAWMGAFAPWIKQGSWKAEELKKLSFLSKKCNNHHWDLVARELGTGRTAYDCAVRVLSCNGAISENKTKWTKQKSAVLRRSIKHSSERTLSWKKVAHKTDEVKVRKCLRRYESLQMSHGKWTAEEDDRLLEAVAKYGKNCWRQIAAAVTTRTDSQCRNRYIYCLSVNSKGGAWSQLEDELLMLGVEVFGTRWMKVCFLLPRRGAHKIHNRYKFLQLKRCRSNRMLRNRKQPIGCVKCNGIPLLPDHLLSILTEEQRRRLKSGLTAVRMKYSRNVE